MKILLDNCVPYRAKQLFTGHEVTHTADIGFEKLRNGELIARASTQFDVLVTTDKKIRHEHNLGKLLISVVELNTKFTRLTDLLTLGPHIAAALLATQSYRFVSVNAEGTLEHLAERVP